MTKTPLCTLSSKFFRVGCWVLWPIRTAQQCSMRNDQCSLSLSGSWTQQRTLASPSRCCSSGLLLHVSISLSLRSIRFAILFWKNVCQRYGSRLPFRRQNSSGSTVMAASAKVVCKYPHPIGLSAHRVEKYICAWWSVIQTDVNCSDRVKCSLLTKGRYIVPFYRHLVKHRPKPSL